MSHTLGSLGIGMRILDPAKSNLMMWAAVLVFIVLAKISFDRYTGPKQRNPAGVTIRGPG